MARSFKFILGLLCASLCCASANATYYYVSTSGDDSNNGTSSSTPFLTIKKAAAVAENGDTVYVASGTYSDAFDVVGVQNSTSALEFREQYGTVVVSGAVRIINSNNVIFRGFRFAGAAERIMIWSGSYDGSVIGCEFPSGDEGILVQDGSVTFDDCTIENFSHDGLQVDGEALVHITQSTISACQENGVEIRKTSRVVLDGSTVSDNVGDGIRLAITTGTVDIGEDPSSGGSSNQLLVSLGGFLLDNGGEIVGDVRTNDDIVLSSGSQIDGDAYHGPGHSTNPASAVTGSVGEIPQTVTLDPIDPGDAAINNDNDQVPSQYLDSGGVFLMDSGNDITLPGGIYYFKDFTMKGAAILRFSGPAIVYVEQDAMVTEAAKVNHSGGNEEFLELYVMGSTVTVKEDGEVHGGIYAPNATIVIQDDGEVRGLAIGDRVEVKSSGRLRSDSALSSMAEKVLGAGQPSSPQPPTGWTPISSGEVVISGSTITGNTNGVNLLDNHSFDTRFTDFSSNTEWGLQLRGVSRVEDCTINSNSIGGIWLTNVNTSDLTVSNNSIANNTTYGLYSESCNLTFDASNIVDWVISGSNELFTANGGSITFDGVTVTGGTTAAVYVYQGTLTTTNAVFSNSGYGLALVQGNGVIDGCTLSGNNVGLYANQNSSLTVRDTSITGSTTWGSTIYASGVSGDSTTLDNCTVHSNTGGLGIFNDSNGEVSLVSGTVVRDNSNAGIHFGNCTLTINDQAAGTNWRTLRNGYGISAQTSTLTLTDLLVEESSLNGVRCENSSVALSNCQVSGMSGVYTTADNIGLTMSASTLTATAAGGLGVRQLGGDVTITNSVFDGFDTGVSLETSSLADDIIVANSTLANLTSAGVVVNGGSVTMRNAIVAGSGTAGLSVLGGNVTHSHNLIHGFTTAFSGVSADATELTTPPRFEDAAAGDFHLAKGSPAINSGTDLSAWSPTDIDGNMRPKFWVFDIGAYEFTSGNGSFRVLQWSEQQ